MAKRNIFPGVFLSFFLLLMISPLSAKETVPEPLAPWLPWVLKGKEALNCPFINHADYADEKAHLCAWPDTLILDAQPQQATFHMSWRVLAKSLVPFARGRKKLALAGDC